MITERPSLEWTKIMEHSPSSGPRLWNALAQVDQDYGKPSFEYTRLWNALQRVVKITECLPRLTF